MPKICSQQTGQLGGGNSAIRIWMKFTEDKGSTYQVGHGSHITLVSKKSLWRTWMDEIEAEHQYNTSPSANTCGVKNLGWPSIAMSTSNTSTCYGPLSPVSARG